MSAWPILKSVWAVAETDSWMRVYDVVLGWVDGWITREEAREAILGLVEGDADALLDRAGALAGMEGYAREGASVV